MKKILVTGAAGFLGRYALEAIRKQQWQEIHAVSRVLMQRDNQGVQWHTADLLCLGDVQRLIQSVRPTHLLHCAWEATPGQYWNSPKNYLWSQMGINLVETFHQHGGQKVVVAGTCAEYDWNVLEDFEEEKTPLHPESVYGKSKRDLFLALEEFSQHCGLQLAWARIFFVYGPFEHEGRLVASCIRALLKNREFICKHGYLIRDFLHVSDVGSALSVMLQSDIKGAVNVASGQGVSLGALIEKTAAMIGKEKLIRIDYTNGHTKPGDRVVGKNNKLKNMLEWAPRLDLEEGLRRTIDWWAIQGESGENA